MVKSADSEANDDDDDDKGPGEERIPHSHIS